MVTDPTAFAGSLACLPGMGPATLGRLLDHRSPPEVWDQVLAGILRRPAPTRTAGRTSPPLQSWAAAAARFEPEAAWRAWQDRGISVTWRGGPGYPRRLLGDPQPPAVLFWSGSLHGLEGTCVAIVGTRRCSPDGRASAYEMGKGLAAAGVCVVSGLALGIDGAAHRGALDSPGASHPGPGSVTVGVAASGVDVVYPPAHSTLWERVVSRGAVVSETPPGHPAQAWRFPSRNRIIAGLADLVVVVESHARGGALLTADMALDRGVEVRVVPGPVQAPCAAGSNQLLYDGPGPVRNATDVLDALGVLRSPAPGFRRRRPHRRPAASGAGAAAGTSATSCRPGADDDPVGRSSGSAGAPGGAPGGGGDGRAGAVEVLDAIGWRPTSLARIVERSGLPVGVVGRLLGELSAAGQVREDQGWWSRSTPEPDGTSRQERTGRQGGGM